MGLVEDGEPYYCAHCEFEYPADWYVAHMPQCIAWHIEAWPIHDVDFMSACPMLCGKPHMTEEEKNEIVGKLITKLNRQEFVWSTKPLRPLVEKWIPEK